MAFMELKIHSDCLGHGVSVNVIIPQYAETIIGMDGKEEANFKTLYLLHGLSDDHTAWARRTSIERYAAERCLAVVMPCVDRSWYTDTVYGAKYFSFITDELPYIMRKIFRGMSDKREDNFIGGLSMGGYGAMKACLTYPDKYFGCIALSGAFDIENMARNLITDEWKYIFGMNEPEELRETKHDVFHLARVAAENGVKPPKIYMWCGYGDFIHESSEKMDKVLTDCGIDHLYEKSEGDHSWGYWDKYVCHGIDYVLGE